MRFVLAKVVFFAGETHVRPYELRVNIVKTNQRIVCVTCEIEEYAMYKRLQSNGDGTRHPRAPRARPGPAAGPRGAPRSGGVHADARARADIIVVVYSLLNLQCST